MISEFEYLAQDYGSSRWLIGGTQDNGSQRWTGSQVWDHVADGDGGDCGVNRATPRTVFHTYCGMSPERSTTSGNFGSWAWIAPPVPAGEGSPFYPPFECSASGGDTIAIAGDALYVSRNSGTAWTRLALPAGARSSALYIPNVDNVFVGTADGRIFRTRWTGAGWSAPTALTTPRANASVSDLPVDPSNLSRMWATHRTVGGGRVFSSTDGGSAWADRTAGLPGLPINAIEIDPWNRNRIWVAADLGVYQSHDGGASWTDFSNGLPNMYVGDLVFHPHARVLRAGTRNRGVLGDPGRRLDDAADLRRAVHRQPHWKPDAPLVHVQLAGDMARHLDRDADDAASGCAAGLVDRPGRAGQCRVCDLLDHGPQPHPGSGHV